jgi:hypothetical protein
MKRVI